MIVASSCVSEKESSLAAISIHAQCYRRFLASDSLLLTPRKEDSSLIQQATGSTVPDLILAPGPIASESLSSFRLTTQADPTK